MSDQDKDELAKQLTDTPISNGCFVGIWTESPKTAWTPSKPIGVNVFDDE